MKRLIAVLLVICMLSAALAGCAKQNDGQEEATTKGSDATAASEGTTAFVPDIAKKDYKKSLRLPKSAVSWRRISLFRRLRRTTV